jgi:methylated-DNA-[protein]-cysteine S-methyltransferase
MMLVRNRMIWTTFDSPIGTLTLTAEGEALTGLRFPVGLSEALDPADLGDIGVTTQLAEYFRGERTEFDIEVVIRGGTDFQRSVWAALPSIPYGETLSYGELTRRIGFDADHTHVRAVAGAVGRTPVPIVIPCHRVIGSDGSLTGYGGGLDRKRHLLDLEAGQGSLL